VTATIFAASPPTISVTTTAIFARRTRFVRTFGVCDRCGRFDVAICRLRVRATATTAATAATPAAAAIGAGRAFAYLVAFDFAGSGIEAFVFRGVRFRTFGGLCFTGAIATSAATAATAIAAIALAVASDWFAAFDIFGFAGLFEEVGNVEKGIALKADVHKAGLHARKNARDLAVVNRARECVLVFTLVIDFGEFVFFDDGQTRLMGRTGYINFF
jgi:hypothetical protein